MVRRPDSIPGARLAMHNALLEMNERGVATPCFDRPVLYTEIRQTPEEAAELCGRGTSNPCPVLELCAPLGYTESVYADDMVYGGYTWRRGNPVVSETERRRRKAPKDRALKERVAREEGSAISNGRSSIYA